MFDLDELITAHYHCDYDFLAARVYRDAFVDPQRAEHLLTLPLPSADLDFDPFAIASLLAAARQTGRGDFCGKAVAMVEAILGLSNWRYPHHQHMSQVDLGMAVVSNRLSHLYEEMHDAELPDLRSRIRQAIITRGLDPFYQQVTDPKRPGWVRTFYNWRSYICADMGRAAFRLADVYPRWRDCVAEAIKGCLAVADVGGEDGGWEEGVGYWGMAFGQAANFAEELYAASRGRVDLFCHPYFQVAGDFGLYCPMPGHKAVYAFSDWHVGGPRRDLMQSLAQHMRNPHYQWCADRSSDPAAHQWVKPVQAKSPQSLVPCKHFRGIDVAVLRTGWGKDDTVVGFKCGPRRVQAHQHLDANSFVLYAGAEPVVDELDACTPLDCRGLYDLLGIAGEHASKDAELGVGATIAHSTLLVQGGGQLQGRNEGGQIKPVYRTRGQRPVAHGEVFPRDCSARIIGFAQSLDLSYVIGEAAPSYSPPLDSFCRTVVLLPPDRVVVADRLEARADASICSLFHVPGRVEQVDERSMRIAHGGASATVNVEAAGSSAINLACEAVPWQLESGEERWVIAATARSSAPFLWVVSSFSLGGRGPKPDQVTAIRRCDSDRLLLQSSSDVRPVAIALGKRPAVAYG